MQTKAKIWLFQQTLIQLFRFLHLIGFLARALEREVISQMRREQLCFTSVIEEITCMQSKETLRNASCTLLVCDQEVATYKPYGFLFDANTSQILHASPQDSNSCTSSDGDLIAYGQSMTIEELAAFVRKTPVGERESMNEVNANFTLHDKGHFCLLRRI